MQNVNKNILAKYLNLQSKKAEEYLEGLAGEVKKEIIESLDNDQVLENLELLEEFVYKVPKQTIDIARYVIDNPKEVRKRETPLGVFEGKKHTDCVAKVLELLNRVRYIYPEGVLPILAESIKGEDSKVREKALEVLKNFAQYDYNVLYKSKLGYQVQRFGLDFILKWPTKKQLDNLDFVEVVSSELLGSSVEGTTYSEVDKITIHFSVVDPTDYLKKIRRETIDLVIGLYKVASETVDKLKIISVLDEASQLPGNVQYKPEVHEMVVDDSEYILSKYKEILLSPEGALTASIPVLAHIDEKLYWLAKHEILGESAMKFRKRILTDGNYSFFRLFAGNDIFLRDESGWEQAEKERNTAVEKNVESVNEENLDQWTQKINMVASELGLIPEWQFSVFKNFLFKLAANKPKLSADMLEDAIVHNKPLRQFTENTLDGLRQSEQVGYWDQIVQVIVNAKRDTLVAPIVVSMYMAGKPDLSKHIRESDLELLENVIHRTGRFDWIPDETYEQLRLDHAVVSTLIRLHRAFSEPIEPLIIDWLKTHPQWQDSQVSSLAFAIHNKALDFHSFSPQGVDFIKDWLVGSRDLDWNGQIALMNLGEKNIKIIFDILWARIEHDAQQRENLERPERLSQRYEAIPDRLNPELAERINSDPDSEKYLQAWLANTTEEWSIQNWHVGEFLSQLGTNKTKIIMTLVSRGDDVSLAKAANIIDRFAATDFDLCIEIVKRTDNPDIWSKISGAMFSTGVVSGEDGIARAYEAKAETLKKYLEDSNERVKRFASEARNNLLQRAKEERKRAAEEHQLREVEFRG